jgi:molybdopterin molybdotransferase
VVDNTFIEIYKAISPFENVIQPGDDFKKGSTIVEKGKRLRPQDVGALASFGIDRVNVFKRPKVAIISTGDEIIPITEDPSPGKIRDINSYTLGAFCRKYNADPILMGICGDDEEFLQELVSKSLSISDTVWISGGSSIGKRDVTLKVLKSINDVNILVHGISISPGKPTIIARTKDHKAIFGLPGHTASAMVVAEIFLSYFLLRIGGVNPIPDRIHSRVQAELERNIESAGGRDDFIRVRLVPMDRGLVASPVFGKSGLLSTLVQGDGLIHIDRNTEGLYKGQQVEVILLDEQRFKGGKM